MDNAPIGVFDSGLGGLTIWSELYKRLPHESLIYYGDGKNCPYGDKSREELTAYVDYAVEQLLERGVKMIVVACNTATALVIDHLRERWSLPFVGLEPAVRPAIAATRSGVVGVLATAGTLNGALFRQTRLQFQGQVELICVVGEGFVELVEGNKENSAEAFETVRGVLEQIIARGADQVVLGCTHYPFLRGVMQEVIGGREVELINPAAAIERRVSSLLEKNNLEASPTHQPEYTFMTSADEPYRQRLIDKARWAQTFNFE